MDDLERLLDHLGIKERITLVLHDWGGMIGMAYAVRHRSLIKRLVILNTAAFHLPKEKRFPFTLKLCRDTRLGAFLVRGLNAFSVAASFVGCKANPMSKDMQAGLPSPLRHVAEPYRNAPFRPGHPSYPRRPGLRPGELSGRRARGIQRPSHGNILGRKGLRFRHLFSCRMGAALSPGRGAPLCPCGHYILEDMKEEVIPLIAGFLARTDGTEQND